ncbi:hypothetical protein A7E78_02145 [Syntrophotalea acetylenivorans]|uniref:Phosphohistidine phosphatase n=1 Tax=Syntrophotalea acetylenivorans TaxID=1842532 RepID=A0A1L3GTG3_9BACT|nr:histidine phosphatase family protein [Syntrophotalea acetylenivorans]APG28978.1 hypothetical protein A7E78_02145 [Syntrophotalea acetylenivorans]
MTKRLTLLRHAKSSWRDPDLTDFDRPLNKRGQRDAPMMGRRLAKRGFAPDLFLVSPALRTRLTAEIIAEQLEVDIGKLSFDHGIYLAGAHELINLLRCIDEQLQDVLLIGHNPGITDLANYLVGACIENVPTCGVFSVSLPITSWRDLEGTAGNLLFYDYPKKHIEP